MNSINQKKTRAIICVFAVLAVLMPAAHAAGFDCSRASSQVEKLICNTPLLSKADEQLKITYEKVVKLAPNPRWVKEQQRSWLTKERDTCGDAECLANEYARRIAVLNADLQYLEAKGLFNVCDAVAGYLNRATLDSLAVRSKTTIPDDKVLASLFGEVLPDYDVSPTEYWSLDLNGDGVSDHLLAIDQGRIHTPMAFVVSGKNLKHGFSVFGDDGNGSIQVIWLGGRNYVYSDDVKLWEMNSTGDFLQKCEFASRGAPAIKVTFGNHNPLCAEIKGVLQVHPTGLVEMKENEQFTRLVFDKHHNLKPEDYESAVSNELTIADSLAVDDIDNDGKPDKIVKLEASYLGALPCSSTYPAVTNNAATKIPASITNNLLSALGGYRCSPSIEAIAHRGTTYVHVLNHAPEIYLIKNGKSERLCAFAVLREYEGTAR